ncbi:16S rRNA (guanine(527)-N(7))-methyltransferase RsmG [Stomatobaculum longum]|jgi:16S rRNA methyltransferase gidB|uniref:16S rRNA (guanine(527)-N(7))-methyltransferase RsmG n=1 Tax=Stomatobaculum longum TaxID=796942 RepID=UPI0028EC21B3|nr:16S rRNA (guanine(527)-N(7))-methyltransferase RsmG [Stomatobaculum longum]
MTLEALNEFVRDMRTALELFPESRKLSLSDGQIAQFAQFYEDMLEKNQVMNLTGITERREVIVKHYIDSLLPTCLLPDFPKPGTRLLDLGSGAGFPGIPLAIAFPNLQLTLMDSLNKRIVYLTDEIEKLGLQNHTEALHARAEELARQAGQREAYDYCSSRAVARLAVLSEYCLPFVKVGGQMLAYKAGEIEEELSEAQFAIKKLGGTTDQVVSFSLPDDAGKRSLVVIRKIKETPRIYPRKAGMPTKAPLMQK